MESEGYVPKTPMMAHQREAFGRFYGSRAFALLWEQRARKSKVIIDLAAARYEGGDVDALLVIAWPSGVHRNWVADEVPAHLPDRVPRLAVAWSSGRASSKAFAAELEALLEFRGLAILTVNCEAIIVERCRAFLRRFLRARRTFVVGDESSWFKEPGAARTKTMLAIGAHPNVAFRAILDGTPGEDPFDFYTQFRFLGAEILGFTSYFAYRNFFAEFETKEARQKGTGLVTHTYKAVAVDPETGKKKYRNLDILRARMAPASSRVLRSEISDAPPKVYQKRRYELSAAQRKVYDALREESVADLSAGRGRITAAHVLTKYLRLQQVLSNWFPPRQEAVPHAACGAEGCEACGWLGAILSNVPAVAVDTDGDPRADALRAELDATGGVPTIVWSRFTRDVDVAAAVLRERGARVALYDGRSSDDEKLEARRGFQEGRYDALSGNVAAGQRGIRLDRAKLVVFYSNGFSLIQRLQAEDRAEDLDKEFSTDVVDVVAADTVDERIVAAYREKKSVVDTITGDDPRGWL